MSIANPSTVDNRITILKTETFTTLSKDQLLHVCKRLNVQIPTGADKAELVKELKAANLNIYDCATCEMPFLAPSPNTPSCSVCTAKITTVHADLTKLKRFNVADRLNSVRIDYFRPWFNAIHLALAQAQLAHYGTQTTDTNGVTNGIINRWILNNIEYTSTAYNFCNSYQDQASGFMLSALAAEYDPSIANPALQATSELFDLPLPDGSASVNQKWSTSCHYMMNQFPTFPQEILISMFLLKLLDNHTNCEATLVAQVRIWCRTPPKTIDAMFGLLKSYSTTFAKVTATPPAPPAFAAPYPSNTKDALTGRRKVPRTYCKRCKREHADWTQSEPYCSLCNHCHPPSYDLFCQARQRDHAKRNNAKQPAAAATAPASIATQLADFKSDIMDSIKNEINSHYHYIKSSLNLIGALVSLKLISLSSYILDSGAGQHFIGTTKHLTNIKPVKRHVSATTADGTILPATHVGTLRLPVGLDEFMIIKNVYYIPKLKFNLISVSRLVQHQQFQVQFRTNQAILTQSGPSPQITAALDPQIGIYTINTTPLVSDNSSPAAVSTSTMSSAQLKIIHDRLGHPNLRTLKAMFRDKNASGMSHQSPSPPDCEHCETSKAKMASHKPTMHTDKVFTNVGEEIHFDILHINDKATGFKGIYLTCVDAKSRFAVGSCLSSKVAATRRMKHHIHWYQRRANVKVIIIRVDGAGELGGGKHADFGITSWATANGIDIITSVAYDKPTHGMVERFNQTVQLRMSPNLDHAQLNFQHDHKLSMEMVLTECFHTSIYQYNRTRHSSLGMTPFQAFYGKIPNIKNMRRFGCLVTVTIPPAKRSSKVRPRSIKGIFMGYSPLYNAYRVYFPHNKEVVVSSGVTFHEGRIGWHRSSTFSDATLVNDYTVVNNDQDKLKIKLSKRPKVFSTNEETVVSPNPVITSDPILKITDTTPASSQLTVVAHPPSTTSTASIARHSNAHSNVQFFDDGALSYYDPISSEEQIWDPPDPAVITVILLSATPGPKSYKHAMLSNHHQEWKKAIEVELHGIIKNKTWVEVPTTPKDVQILPSRFLFHLKRNPDGSVKKYKCRLVVLGNLQKFQEHFFQKYAPVVHLTSVRFIIALASIHLLVLRHFDISNAFCHADIDQVIFIRGPIGTPLQNKIFRLQKALYGLRQSPRLWNEALHKLLMNITNLHITPTPHDPCLYIGQYIHDSITHIVLIAVHIDDILIAAAPKVSDYIYEQLNQSLTVTDLGNPTNYLGMEIRRNPNKSYSISATSYINDTTKEFAHFISHNKNVPRQSEDLPRFPFTSQDEAVMSNIPYRQVVGKLQWIAVLARPDIQDAVRRVSVHTSKPHPKHWDAVVHLLGYIRNTSHFSIHYSTKGHPLPRLYTDSDYAKCLSTSSSISGWVVTLADAPISWQSKRQTGAPETSTAHAELGALSLAVKKNEYLPPLLKLVGPLLYNDFKFNPLPIFIDNNAAAKLATDPDIAPRLRQTRVDYHRVRYLVLRDRHFSIHRCKSQDNLADIFTKGLNKQPLYYLLNQMNLF